MGSDLLTDTLDRNVRDVPPLKTQTGKEIKVKHHRFTNFDSIKIDGRREWAKWIKEEEERLIQHCGGEPSYVEREIIKVYLNQKKRRLLAQHAYLKGLTAGTLTANDISALTKLEDSMLRKLMALGLKARGNARASLDVFRNYGPGRVLPLPKVGVDEVK